jgi:nucleoside-diphosphate-sugar epimerase
MKCLVTGSSGFIGNALVNRLAENNNSVKALIHTKNLKKQIKGVKYITADITNPESLKDACFDVEVVFHCAALVKDYGFRKDFYKVNVEGTKNVVNACSNLKKFIYIGHIFYESEKKFGYYSQSKRLAEQYLLEKFKKEKLPVIILCPGNVYGPRASTWVLRPLHAIKNKKIALINQGSGIFLHTYIDNFLDALMLAAKKQNIFGKTFNITDGDNLTTWKTYLNDLAKIAGEKPINKNISKSTAIILSKLSMTNYYLTHNEPLVTSTAVKIFTNKQKISIKPAENLLGYKPQIDYPKAIKYIKEWLEEEHYV